MNVTLLTYTFSLFFRELSRNLSELGQKVSIIGRNKTFRHGFSRNIGVLCSGLLPVFEARTIKKLNTVTDVYAVNNFNGLLLDRFISRPWLVHIPSVSKEGIEILGDLSPSDFRQTLMKYLSISYAIPQALCQEYSIRNADVINTPCKYTKEKIVETYRVDEKKICVNSPGVDVGKFRPGESTCLQKRLGLPRRAKVILYVGRVTLAKGFFGLVEAFRKVSNSEETYLVIVGPCPVRSLVPTKCLTSEIRFTGVISYDEMPEIYNSAYMLVHPSYFEGTPLCILEAMASGIPVVARSAGGISEIISNNKQGFIVNSTDEMTERMDLLLANSALATTMGMNGRKRVLKHHSWRKNAIGLLKEFRRLAS
jgi:glycosyltransferase involved in cell wall biosynthesis